MPTQRKVRNACEQSGGDYYCMIAIWNREGKPMVINAGPATKPYCKRVAIVQMDGIETRNGLNPKKKAGGG